MANATVVKTVKKVKLFEKRVNFDNATGNKTLREFFGKVSTVGKVTKALWVAYKKDGLLLD